MLIVVAEPAVCAATPKRSPTPSPLGVRDGCDMLQELGMTLEGVPEVAQVSTAQMGLRMLRAKALGMPQRDVLLLLYRVPVVFLWDDECAPLCPAHHPVSPPASLLLPCLPAVSARCHV